MKSRIIGGIFVLVILAIVYLVDSHFNQQQAGQDVKPLPADNQYKDLKVQ